MPDKERVFDALRNCITEPKCRNCPWEDCERFKCKRVDVPVSLMLDVLKLLKEQEEVVHCGDCENFCFDNISPNAGRCMLTNMSHSKTWFCAHGKREET